MTPEDKLSQLEARLALLEARERLADTMNKYGHSIDYGDHSGWLDCFTEDGIFEITYHRRSSFPHLVRQFGEVTEHGVRYKGKQALGSFIEGHTHAPNAWHKHFLVESRVTFADQLTSANAASYFARLDDRNDERIIMAFGRYIDDLKLGDDGMWRFSSRIVQVESAG